jgi:hypothetical protein
MATVNLRKSPVEQILEEMIEKAGKKNEFSKENIDGLKQLIQNNEFTKSPKIIEAIKTDEAKKE